MSISQSKEQFDSLFQQKYNKAPIQLQFEFNEQIKEPKLSEYDQKLKKAIEYNPNKDKDKN